VTVSDARNEEFEAATAPYRRELFAHCYRMTGSVGDAEDLVQETYLRAWQAFDRFEGRSSMRTWMYRIATNASLSALSRNRRRPLPSGLGAPSSDPAAPPRPPPDGVAWLEPVPDRLVIDELSDPAEIVTARHSVRLALVAAFQLLPPRQRAALILCETLELPASEAAEILQISVAASRVSCSGPAPASRRPTSAMPTWPSRLTKAPAGSSTGTWRRSDGPTRRRSSACWPMMLCLR
jgi:RNA polymerase sigma-70 factor (ECF subfamily)